jgi:ABC-type sugar transport system permease subunit
MAEVKTKGEVIANRAAIAAVFVALIVMLLSLAGHSAVPKHRYEAAEIDRAGPFYTFFRITQPQVAPIQMIAIIFRTKEAFKTIDHPDIQ